VRGLAAAIHGSDTRPARAPQALRA
jgi:hypothetical protein